MNKKLFLCILCVLWFFSSVFAFDPVLLEYLPIVDHDSYILQYNPNKQAASYVIYRLNAGNSLTVSDREDASFKTDNMVSVPVKPSVYDGSGYDTGHLVPAGDMRYSPDALRQSMFTSNTAPQVPAFNRGIWKKLENQLRKEAAAGADMVIIVGPVFYKTPLVRIKETVAIPDGFFKIVYRRPSFAKATADNPPTLANSKATADKAYLFGNKAMDGKPDDYLVDIKIIRQVTGIDFK